MAVNLAEHPIHYPEFPKYIWDSTSPYSDALNIKKDKRDPERTKRPLNAFMLFAKIQRDHITTTQNCNHSEISKALGKVWQELSKEEKEPFNHGARVLVELHRREYPEYKYRPRKKGQPGQEAVVANRRQTSRKPAVSRATGNKQQQQMSRRQPRQQQPGSPSSAWSPAGLQDTTSHLHPAYSPLSIGSSSGYESEAMSTGLPPDLSPSYTYDDGLVSYSPDPFQNCMSPEPQQCCISPERLPACVTSDPLVDCAPPEPDMAADLCDIEVTALDGSSLLNPLTMFPTLDLTEDDLDDLRFSI